MAEVNVVTRWERWRSHDPRGGALETEAPGKSARRVWAVGLALVLGACADGSSSGDASAPAAAPGGADGTPASVPVLTLGDEPTLEIGVLEGEAQYQLEEVVSVRTLASEAVAVSDAGANTVLVYDEDGRFLRSIGGRGEGPGEFRGLSRVYAAGGDSLLALDAWTGRVSLFDAEGAFVRQMDATTLSGDSVFRMDAWLHGRFWVDGALKQPERERVRAVLDRLPHPRARPGYRLVRVADDGALWIREPGIGDNGWVTWTVLDPGGSPVASADLPMRFDPQELRPGTLAGRWLGTSDVNYVRRYDLVETGTSRRIPDWLTADEHAEAPAQPKDGAFDAEEFMAEIRSTIKHMESAQEIHYSRNGTYTPLVDSLDWVPPESIVVDMIQAGTRGWAGVFTHPAVDRICGLGYGSGTPPGWRGGMVSCAPEESSEDAFPGG